MSIIAFGKNTVSNLIGSEFLTFKKVIILEEKKREYKPICEKLAREDIPYEVLTKEVFIRYIPDKKHQGIIAFVNDYNYSSLPYLVRRRTNNKNPILVMLDGIEDPHNFGAILRTCAAFNIDGVIISSKNQVPVNSTVVKVSTGGVSHVPVCMVDSLEEALNTLKNNSYRIVTTICSKENVMDYKKLSLQQPICVVFGSEHEGIRKSIIRKTDFSIMIPMKNEMNSLNVSVSCGIILSFFVGSHE